MHKVGTSCILASVEFEDLLNDVPGELLHVTGPVWLVVGQNRGRFPQSNSILIRDSDATALIDTGCGIETLRGLSRHVDLVINTHTHPDHCAGNFVFAGRTILVPNAGASTAGDLRALSERFFVDPELRPIWRRFIRERMGWSDQQISGTYHADQVIPVGSTRVLAVSTPGHTVDHCCLLVPEHGVLVSADIDLTRFGPWYGHRESELQQLRRSMEVVRNLEPQVVLSAHRPPVRGDAIEPALRRFAGVVDQRSERLQSFLAREHSWSEIVDAALIYGGFPYAEQLMRCWEGEMVRKHLLELMAEGVVEETDHGFKAR